jgi:hypothetical protein
LIPSKHDWLIRHLLIVEAIVVVEELVGADSEELRNLILVRSRKHDHILKPAVLEPNIADQPRFRVSVPQPDGSLKRTWLGPNRVVWVHYNGPTRNNIGFVDGDPWNYNFWNLREFDQNDQNFRRLLKEQAPDEGSSSQLEEELPF